MKKPNAALAHMATKTITELRGLALDGLPLELR